MDPERVQKMIDWLDLQHGASVYWRDEHDSYRCPYCRRYEEFQAGRK